MSKKFTSYIWLSLILLSVSACTYVRPSSEPQADQPALPSKEVPEAPKNPEITKRLILRNASLDKLPAYVLTMTSLEELDISDNQLTGALPAEIRKLQGLRILDASGNKMTGVPAEIGQLVNLEQLDLSNNLLTGLPYELGNLKNLKTMILTGNQYSEQDLAIIREKLPTTNFIL